MKIMASSPIPSWQINGETMETVRDFIFLDSKITADCDCSYEIKRLAPWNKSFELAHGNGSVVNLFIFNHLQFLGLFFSS